MSIASISGERNVGANQIEIIQHIREGLCEQKLQRIRRNGKTDLFPQLPQGCLRRSLAALNKTACGQVPAARIPLLGDAAALDQHFLPVVHDTRMNDQQVLSIRDVTAARNRAPGFFSIDRINIQKFQLQDLRILFGLGVMMLRLKVYILTALLLPI